MPANPVEIEAAEEEGVEFIFLAAPQRVLGDEDGNCTHLEYLKMELGEPDASGRRRPVPIEGSETKLPTDMVITAIGQAPDVTFVERDQMRLAELKTTRRSTIETDPHTLQTSIPYLFSAGDSATGPALVVTAIGGGRRAARSIHQYVMGQEVKAAPMEHMGKQLLPDSDFDHVPGIVKKPRSPMEELPADERNQIL